VKNQLLNLSRKDVRPASPKYLFLSILFMTFFSLYSCDNHNKGRLKDQIEVLELTYIPWGCDCANWATSANIELYHSNEMDSLAIFSVFIEPASEELTLPDSRFSINTQIRFTGSFYEKPGFPKGYKSIESPDPASVFRYTHYEILERK